MNPKFPKRLPDARYFEQKNNYAHFPLKLLHSPKLSCRAKVLLGMFLSNNGTWVSYKVQIRKSLMEGKSAIDTAFGELGELGHLLYFSYRDKESKSIAGGFWAVTATPWQFDITDNLQRIEQMGMELVNPKGESLEDDTEVDFQDTGNPASWKSAPTKIREDKKKKTKKRKREEGTLAKNIEFVESPKSSAGVPGAYSKEYDPGLGGGTPPDRGEGKWSNQVADLLAGLIKQTRGRGTPSETFSLWVRKIEAFVFNAEIRPIRVMSAMSWYIKHGEEGNPKYRIKVRTMSEFCEKFDMIEDRMNEHTEQEEQDSPKEPSPLARAITKIASHLSAQALDVHLAALEPQWAKIGADLKRKAGPYELEPGERWGNNEHALYYTHWQIDFTRAMAEYTNWMVDHFEQRYITSNAYNPASKMFALYLDSLDEDFSVHLLR
jgi:hypothetical protein